MESETPTGAEVFTEAGAKAIAAEAVTSMSAADLNTFILLILLYNLYVQIWKRQDDKDQNPSIHGC